MRALSRATGILFQAHLGRVFRTRRGWIAAGLCALPVGLALVVRTASRLHGEELPVEPLVAFSWYFLIQMVVPLVALVMASSVVAEEIEDRTVTYLFTRPIPRAAILFGRWLAVAVPLVLLLSLSAAGVLGTFAGLGPEDWMPEGFTTRLMATAALGGTVYSALFAVAGTLFKRPMLIGLGYTFVYENFLGTLPGSTQKSTVIYYLRSFLFQPHPDLGGEFSELLFNSTLLEPAAAVRQLAGILVVAMALGAWRFSRREYVLAA